jgi:Tfp pilus assembly PilM family ATPase
MMREEIKLFFKRAKKGRTIFQLDYRGVRVVQAQPENGGIRIVSCAHKAWPDQGKELPLTNLEGIKESFQDLINLSGIKGKEVDILFPDCMAKTVILELDSLPKGKNELLKLAYFKGQKSSPYPFEDTRIGIQVLSGNESEGKVRVLAVFISRALIEGLENVLCDLGREPGRIGLASLSLYNLFEKGLNREGDTAFVTVFEEFFSIFLFANGSPAFFRSKSLDARDNRLFFELQTSFLYYQKQNAAYRPQRALLWGIGDMSNIAAWLEELFAVKPEVLESKVPLTIKWGLSLTAEELHQLTPALGMVTK